jgi:hypothetical protein
MKKSSTWKYLIIVVVVLLLMKGIYANGIVHYFGNKDPKFFNFISGFEKLIQNFALSLPLLYVLLHEKFAKKYRFLKYITILTIVLLYTSSLYIFSVFVSLSRMNDISLYLNINNLNDFLITATICLIICFLLIFVIERDKKDI